MYGMSSIEWNDANISTLKKMWSSGHSASQIAAEIPHCTRSAVLGKVSRLKLKPRMAHNARAAAQGVERTTVARDGGATRSARIVALRPKPSRITSSLGGAFAPNPATPPPPLPTSDPSDGKGITMMQLTGATCRWPKGDPLQDGFLYCGDPSANLKDGQPYCPFHTRKATDRAGMRRSHARELRQPQVNF